MPIVGYRNKLVTGQVTDGGLSAAAPPDKVRTMNKDGTYDINTVDYPSANLSDYYIALIRIPTWKFTSILVGFLLGLNLFFASIYFLLGDYLIQGMDDATPLRHFAKDFLFSFQSMTPSNMGLTTISTRIHVLAAVEVVIGLLVFAILTGLIYGRFSKATARLIHSDNALISPYKGIRALTFRVGNARKNQLVNLEWTVMLAFNAQVGDRVVRRYISLPLESNKGYIFPMVWTIVHPIDENSPLLHFTEKDFADGSLEINVLINGFDETFNQPVHTRFGYFYDEIIWGQKFALNFEHQPGGRMKQYLGRISNYVPAELPSEPSTT